MPDKQSIKALMSTYWTSAGWRPEGKRPVDKAAFDHAKRHGVMFEPALLAHDEILTRVLAACSALTPRRVGDAFLASLSSRRLDLRSALGSYSVFRFASPHQAPRSRRGCAVCGDYGGTARREDLNVLNFERFKWGGVRHDDPLYAMVDLELFLREPTPTVADTDIEALRSLLRAIGQASPTATGPSLQAALAGIVRSNKAERDCIVAILGFTGILSTPGHPAYRNVFVSADDRDLPPYHFVDMPYPACWWRGADGIDREALADYFGHVL